MRTAERGTAQAVRLSGWCATRAAFGLAVLTTCLQSVPATGQVVDPNLWGIDGTVAAIARSGNTLYVGGAFEQVGPNTGGGIPLHLGNGAPKAPFPKVTGYVFATVSKCTRKHLFSVIARPRAF